MRTYIFSVVYWILVLIILLLLRENGVIPKYFHGPVHSNYDLLVDLFKQKTTAGLFQTLMDALSYHGSLFGYSYQIMNFVVFVIVQPAFILYFFILCMLKQRQKIFIPKKQFLIFNAIFWSLFVLAMLPFLQGNGVISLATKPWNGDYFQLCCDIMRILAKSCGLSYEEINILIFVILQPALMLYFLILFIWLSNRKKTIFKTQ